MIDIYEPHPNLECEVCYDNDQCLLRWEDDGGSMARVPPLAQAFEEDTEGDHEHHDRPPDGQRHQPI